MILMPQIFYVTAYENARYKHNELEYLFYLPSKHIDTSTLWTIHNGVFGAPNVCNGAPIDEITLSPFIAQKRLLFCNF